MTNPSFTFSSLFAHSLSLSFRVHCAVCIWQLKAWCLVNNWSYLSVPHALEREKPLAISLIYIAPTRIPPFLDISLHTSFQPSLSFSPCLIHFSHLSTHTHISPFRLLPMCKEVRHWWRFIPGIPSGLQWQLSCAYINDPLLTNCQQALKPACTCTWRQCFHVLPFSHNHT